MDNPDASNKEVSLAIRGYGLFAAVRFLVINLCLVVLIFSSI